MKQQEVESVALGNYFKLCSVSTANQFIQFPPLLGNSLFFFPFSFYLFQFFLVLLLLQQTGFYCR